MRSVMDYGASGNGTTDDTSAIQSAIDASAGGDIYLPSGSYLVTDTIYLPNDTKLYGDGSGSVLVAKASFNASAVAVIMNASATTSGNSNVTLEDFAVRFSNASGADWATVKWLKLDFDTYPRGPICFALVNGLNVTRLYTSETYLRAFVWLYGCKNFTFTDCVLDNLLTGATAGGGVWVYGGYDIDNASGAAWDSHTGVFDGCTITSHRDEALGFTAGYSNVYSMNVSGCVLTNDFASSPYSNALIVQGQNNDFGGDASGNPTDHYSENITISDNTLTGGITCGGSSRGVTVDGNTIGGINPAGTIVVTWPYTATTANPTPHNIGRAPSSITITNNNLSAPSTGVYIENDNGTNVVITGNTPSTVNDAAPVTTPPIRTDPLTVTVKPPGREEYALSLEAQPVFSSATGGYEAADIRCQLSDEERMACLGARVRIHGQIGVVWQGIVLRRPGRDEPLVAKGWGWCATLGRREALFCDTRLSEWQERTYENRNTKIEVSYDSHAIRFQMASGVELGTGANGAYRFVPSTTVGKVTFSWERPNLAVALKLYIGLQSGFTASTGLEATWTEVWARVSGSGEYTGSESVAISQEFDALMLQVNAPSDYTPGSDVNAHFSAVKVYGTAVATCDTGNVFTDIIDNEIDTDYLRAGTDVRAWIADETTTVEPLVFDSCDAQTKLAELSKYAAYDYGWYCENVQGSGSVCVPHWTARSTTPDYVLDLAQAESYDLDESALDELASVIRVNYSDIAGRALTTDVTDTDTTHPLVALGITRYADVSAQTTSTVTASAVGVLAVAEMGRQQTKGTVLTRYVYTSTGAPAYLPDIRSGQMVRVFGLPDGYRDTTVRRVTCSSDKLANIELDNEGYSLAIALARLEKRG